MENLSIIYQKEAIEFVTVAKEYLLFMENSKSYTKEQFVETSLKMLPLMYLKGALLSVVSEFDDDYTEKFIDENTWIYIQQIAAAKLDIDDEYVQIQDTTIINDMDCLNVGLSEIYADLYQEMGDLVGAYKTGNDFTMLSALHYCQENFGSYWGIRLLVLLKNIHKLKYKTN